VSAAPDDIGALLRGTVPHPSDVAWQVNRRRFVEETAPRARLALRIESASAGRWRELEGPLEGLPRERGAL
jgi:hypothetical protein